MAGPDYGFDYDWPFWRAAPQRRPQRGHPAWRTRGGYGLDLDYDDQFRMRGPYGAPEYYGSEYRRRRWEADYGDPFHDRERGTRIRMMRGGWDEYGRDMLRYGGEYGRRRRRPMSGRTYPGARAAGEFYGPPGEYGREYRSRRRRYW